MALPNTNGVFIHKGYNCSPTVIPTAQSIPMSSTDATSVKTKIDDLEEEATTTSAGLMSASDKTKLNGIESGAEVNVQSDWNATSGDALILNKPTLGSAASKNVSTSVTSGDPNLVTSGAVYTAISNIPDNDTWRNIKVNGTEKLSADISSGAVDFVNGTNTTVSFNSTGNKVSYDVPVVSSSSAGVAPQGESVSSFDQTSKFLRSDGAWVAPKYTEDTWRPIFIDWQSTSDRALHINAGTNITIEQTATDSSQTATINATDTNTTYTFANGTNGFTVTPSDGAAQTVTVTPDLQLEGTASGAIASFNDGGDNIPVKSLVVDITAVQAGEGTPSPSNPRAISGYTDVVISRNGTNIWNEIMEVGNIDNATGQDSSSSSILRTKTYISVKPNITYFFKSPSDKGNLTIFFYDSEKNFISIVYKINDTVTTPTNAYYIRFKCSSSYGITYNNDISVNYPSTVTTYKAYKGTTFTISLGSTVYGGTLDVVNGVLTIDKTCVTLDPSVTWTKNVAITASNSFTAQAFFANYKREDGLCSHFGVVSSISATEGIYFGSNINIFTPLDLDLDTVEKFTQWITGKNIQVLYSLQTPVVINLTKTQVTTLLNENNIYANSGDISVEYFTQSAKNILDVADSSNKMDFSNPTGSGSLSIGREPGTTIGIRSASIGYANTASGNYAFAEGQSTISSGQGSHSEGRETQATANYAHAEGYKCIASGQRSHAEGTDTTAIGSYSHAEGRETKATTSQAHAEGYQSEASGNSSHAENYETKASGAFSHAEGRGTIAKHECQHVFGEYNLEDESSATTSNRGNYVEIVGNGTSSTRSNARTLDWDGNETLAGDLTINSSTSVGATLSNKVDIPSIDISDRTVDLLTLVQNLGVNGTHYARWICRSDGGSSDISNKPTTANAGFVCIAYCTRWITASDYAYVLECWVRNTKLPYVATVAPSTTSITWYQEVSGSGTSGYLAKFTDSNHVSNGPLLGSDTTKYLRNDGTWQVPEDPKKIDLWNDSLDEYRRCVIALCGVSTTDSTSLNSWSSGTISMHRTNGLHGVFNIEYSIENQYTSAYAANVFSAYSDIDNVPSPTLPKGVSWSWCSFKHNNVWYAGIEYFVADARFDNVMIDYVGNFEPFAFAWYDTKNSAVLDSEFNSSVSYTTPEHKRNEYFNEQIVVRRPIKPVITGTGTPGEDKGSGVSPRYFPAKWTFDTGYAATSGTVVTVQLPVAGHDNGVYMTIDNGAHYYPITTASTNRLTGHFAVNSFVTLVFDEAGSAGSMIPLNGGNSRVTVTGGVWRVLNYYDSGNNRVRQTLASDNTDRPLLLSYANNTTTTTNVDNVSYRCNNIFANPSTGDLTITGSMSIGYRMGTVGTHSVAVGDRCEASGNFSHAEGEVTTASGTSSHSEGYRTTASGNYSHVEGNYTTASGDYSHAEGYFTEATRRSQHVFGEFSILDTQGSDGTVKGKYIEIVGNGAGASTRSNARTLDWSGNETLAGNLTALGLVAGGDSNGFVYVKDSSNTTVAKIASDSSGGNIYCCNASGNESVAFTTGGTGYGQFRVRNASNTIVIQGVGSSGNITCVSLTQTSDAKFKNVSDEAIPDISGIKAVRYTWKDDHKFDESEHIGYLAQDVEKVLPFLVKEDAEGNKALDYIGFLVAKIDCLEKRISELEK